MSDPAKDRLVFDCNVYLQYLINADGAGGRCVRLGLEGAVDFFISPAVLLELRELPERQVCLLRGIDAPKVARLIAALLPVGTLIENVPDVYRHPIDEDDSCYVNLAIAAGAKLIVSNDKHLLNLMNPSKPWSADFRQRFPSMLVLDPISYLRERDLPKQSPHV